MVDIYNLKKIITEIPKSKLNSCGKAAFNKAQQLLKQLEEFEKPINLSNENKERSLIKQLENFAKLANYQFLLTVIFSQPCLLSNEESLNKRTLLQNELDSAFTDFSNGNNNTTIFDYQKLSPIIVSDCNAMNGVGMEFATSAIDFIEDKDKTNFIKDFCGGKMHKNICKDDNAEKILFLLGKLSKEQRNKTIKTIFGENFYDKKISTSLDRIIAASKALKRKQKLNTTATKNFNNAKNFFIKHLLPCYKQEIIKISLLENRTNRKERIDFLNKFLAILSGKEQMNFLNEFFDFNSAQAAFKNNRSFFITSITKISNALVKKNKFIFLEEIRQKIGISYVDYISLFKNNYLYIKRIYTLENLKKKTVKLSDLISILNEYKQNAEKKKLKKHYLPILRELIGGENGDKLDAELLQTISSTTKDNDLIASICSAPPLNKEVCNNLPLILPCLSFKQQRRLLDNTEILEKICESAGSNLEYCENIDVFKKIRALLQFLKTETAYETKHETKYKSKYQYEKKGAINFFKIYKKLSNNDFKETCINEFPLFIKHLNFLLLNLPRNKNTSSPNYLVNYLINSIFSVDDLRFLVKKYPFKFTGFFNKLYPDARVWYLLEKTFDANFLTKLIENESNDIVLAVLNLCASNKKLVSNIRQAIKCSSLYNFEKLKEDKILQVRLLKIFSIDPVFKEIAEKIKITKKDFEIFKKICFSNFFACKDLLKKLNLFEKKFEVKINNNILFTKRDIFNLAGEKTENLQVIFKKFNDINSENIYILMTECLKDFFPEKNGKNTNTAEKIILPKIHPNNFFRLFLENNSRYENHISSELSQANYSPMTSVKNLYLDLRSEKGRNLLQNLADYFQRIFLDANGESKVNYLLKAACKDSPWYLFITLILAAFTKINLSDYLTPRELSNAVDEKLIDYRCAIFFLNFMKYTQKHEKKDGVVIEHFNAPDKTKVYFDALKDNCKKSLFLNSFIEYKNYRSEGEKIFNENNSFSFFFSNDYFNQHTNNKEENTNYKGGLDILVKFK